MERKAGYKIEILTEIPLSDEQILDGKALIFKIDGKEYCFNQFTYQTFNKFNKSLAKAGLEVLSFPDEKKYNENKEVIFKVITSGNKTITSLLDLIVNYAIGWQGCRLIPAIIYKYLFVRKLKYCYIEDMLQLIEKLLEFNWQIKKKLLNILHKDPRRVDPLNSETLQALPQEHLDMLKAGILIPRY